jgi:phenylalanyl-tRNA synthetase beta chain
MRTTLLGSLLGAARGNLARAADRVALFESGRVYLDAPPTDGDEATGSAPVEGEPLAGRFDGERATPVLEPHRLGALAVGPLTPPSWRGGGEPADFFALKGVLEGLAARLGVVTALEPATESFLHPGRAAKILVAGAGAGWIGEVHPLVCREWDLDAAVGFELELSALVGAASAGEEAFEDVTAFPAVLQDLAVVVPDDVSAAQVRDAVLAGGGALLRGAEVFDLFEGEQLGEGRKSLALRLEFHAADRTLTDEEVADLRVAIERELKEIGGELRG